MKKLLLIVLGAILVLILVLVYRTQTMASRQPPVEQDVTLAIDETAALARFAQSLTFPTVSSQDGGENTTTFLEFHAFLRDAFPKVHASLDVETIAGLSLLYTWPGSDPRMEPALLMGHLDVVPVSPGTEGDWDHPPFGGSIEDGYVWGRGSMDDKGTVMALLDAVERLVDDGFAPRRTLYLAFGHDEELGGDNGAAAIVSALESRGVARLAFVLDEGGAISEGLIPGVEPPVAVIGIAEKGSVSLTLRVEGPGGHSSAPPTQTNIGILAAAITRLEADPFPMGLSDASRSFFDFVGPEMPFGRRLVFANLWLFEPLIVRGMASAPASRSSIQTTTAATIIEGGVKSNVLPAKATATVNFRILPGETPHSVADRVKQVIDDDRVEVLGADSGREPSPISATDSGVFRVLGRTIRETAGKNVIVTPYLVTAGTDARHYAGLSDNVYRFTPMLMEEDVMTRVHGTNERLGVDSFVTYVRFFHRLVHNLDAMSPEGA